MYDPWVSAEDAVHEYGIRPVAELMHDAYDGIVLAVAHMQFKTLTAAELRSFGKAKHVLYDLKYVLPASASDLRL